MDNRSHLLDIALDLFAARGYDGVGIQEIVDAAGVTKPTLYHYFASKRGLLEALLESRFGELVGSVRAASEYRRDIRLSLEITARVYFAFAQQQPVFYRMQMGMQVAPPDSEPYQAVAPYSLEQHALLESLFAQSVADHGNMRGRQRAYAATFLGMLNTYIGIYLGGYGELDDALLYQALHQFMHGIFS